MSSDTEVRVFPIASPCRGHPCYALYCYPLMQLHETATRWIAELAARNRSSTHQRNVAYALAHWHSYCSAVGIDYRYACQDDVVAYKNAMQTVRSEVTGEPLSAGTVAQRISALATYYESGVRKGWNLTAITAREAMWSASQLASACASIPIDRETKSLAPRSESTETDIGPLSPEQLRSLLDGFGISCGQDVEGDGRPVRNRLIAEWLAYVGLRVSEVVCKQGPMGLTTHQILQLTPDPHYPFDHSPVRILGKGSKWRSVAVPNWLIAKTIDYIQGERQQAIKGIKRPSCKLFVSGLNSSPGHAGSPITQRAFQKAFSAACLHAGLYQLVERRVHGSSQTRLIKQTCYSPHDLRHTYAIMTYYAERELGNVEPWKPIQAQLGHRHLTTTTDVYLSYVSIHNQWGRDLRRASARELAGLPRA